MADWLEYEMSEAFFWISSGQNQEMLGTWDSKG